MPNGVKHHILEQIDIRQIRFDSIVLLRNDREILLKIFLMNTLFKQITDITIADGATSGEYLNKLFEESGELAREVNQLNGRRKVIDKDSIRANILEEGADSVQCLFALLASVGITFEELVAKISEKNKVWIKKYGINL